MQKIINWGILGTGAMAKRFAQDLQLLPDARLVAVGSRSQEKASVFAQPFNVTYRHGSYQELAENPAVDAVYIATPHSCHHANALLCLAAGKAVLCEKPFAINAPQAAEIIKLARKKRLLVMEAMWTRFLPSMTRLRKLLADKAMGDVRMLAADFGTKADPEKSGRLFDPALGGGALLDIGVYPVSLASMIFGPPSKIAGVAKLDDFGLDKQEGIVLMHPRGQIAVLHVSIEATTFQEASLIGTTGRVKVHSPWWKSTSMTLMRDNLKNDFMECSLGGNGYHYQAAEFMACLRRGKTESEIMPLNETYTILQTLDVLRSQWGVRYPME